jgi:hypothetical protein
MILVNREMIIPRLRMQEWCAVWGGQHLSIPNDLDDMIELALTKASLENSCAHLDVSIGFRV